MSQYARPVAQAVIRRGDEILVIDLAEATTGRRFYRLPGGTIEFGELGADAVVREVREEFGAECSTAGFLGLVENVYTYNGAPGHELVLLYEVVVADSGWYEAETIAGCEDDGTAFTCRWVTFERARKEGRPVYPDGLEELMVRLSAEG